MKTIGSSSAAVVLGLSPWGSPMEVWAEAVGLVERQSSGSAATRRGSGMERGLGSWFAQERGFLVSPGPDLDAEPVRNPTLPFLHARPDFFVWTTPENPAAMCDDVAEVKTARYLDESDGWGEAGGDRIPLHYAAQCQVHMAVCTWVRGCWVPALGTVNDDWRVYYLPRRDALIAKLTGKLARWWDEHVVKGVPPAVDGRERTSRVLDLALKAKGGALVAGPEERARFEKCIGMRATLRDLEGEIETLAQELRLRMGENTELVDERGKLLATWRADKNGQRRWRWRTTTEEYDNE